MAYATIPLRDSAVLTGSYVTATPVIGRESLTIQNYDNNQLIVYADFTKGSLTSAEIKVEFSPDGTTWVQETAGDYAAGVTTLSPHSYTVTASGLYRIPIPMKEAFVRVSAKGNGTVTNSLLSLKAVVAQV